MCAFGARGVRLGFTAAAYAWAFRECTFGRRRWRVLGRAGSALVDSGAWFGRAGIAPGLTAALDLGRPAIRQIDFITFDMLWVSVMRERNR